MEEYLGMIKAFAGNFVPRGFMACNGQLIGIQQYAALYALLGTTYGGNGQTTFGLPDLRGRTVIGTGQGQGLPTNHLLGEQLGAETSSIGINNMPAHNHLASSAITFKVSPEEGSKAVPEAGNSLAASIDGNTNPISTYNTAAPTIPITGGSVATTVGATGGSIPLSIWQPTLAINYIICIDGVFPSRN
ncbi:phage tail protein [Pedobacter gandavensis]|uniref:phage tail protein n=1 Tax=Pedobacter gandavensis TaxID=2679963 RepID=UPI00292ED407|nr:tail fiber protein [Pedobacter gandavensis]